MATIQLNEREMQLINIAIQRKEKHLKDNYKNSEKNNRTDLMEKYIERMKEFDKLKSNIQYQLIEQVEFYEKE